MASFNTAFDRTFLAPASTPAPRLGDGGCAEAHRLGWLTPSGWCYWAFEAPHEEVLAIESQATYLRGAVRRDTRRQTEPTLLLRTATLDTPTRRVLSTVYESASVFLLTTDPATGNLSATSVRVTPATVALSRSQVPYEGLSVQITLPLRFSFRTL